MEVVFAGVPLLARPGLVMTPRPSTERLVARAAELVDARPARVADVGTGSGAIAVALALRAPHAEIWATDTSRAAVELAQANAEWHGVGGRVHLLVGDLLGPVRGPLDLVLANLPYLPEGDSGDDDLAGEPREALYAPGDGLGPSRRLLAQARPRLAPHGMLLLQYRGELLEAPALELARLDASLHRLALAAAA